MTTYETWGWNRNPDGNVYLQPELAPTLDIATPYGASVFSAAVSPAKTSPSPDSAEGSPGNAAASSTSSPESLSLFDPDGFSSRTYPDCSPRTAVGTSESLLGTLADTRVRRGLAGFSTPSLRSAAATTPGVHRRSPSLTEILEPPQSVPDEVLAVGTRCDRHPATRTEAGPEPAVASLSGLGSGGPDDNDGQQGRLVANTLGTRWRNNEGDGETFIAAPLSHGSNPNSNMAGRRREDDYNLVTAFHPTQDPIHGEEFTPALGVTSAGMGVSIAHGVAFRGRDGGISAELSEEIAPSMRSGKGSASRGSHALVGASVRRLTPRECERLQGLPDDWTLVPQTAPDSRRYAGLGDAVTSPVGEWIGRRLLEAST